MAWKVSSVAKVAAIAGSLAVAAWMRTSERPRRRRRRRRCGRHAVRSSIGIDGGIEIGHRKQAGFGIVAKQWRHGSRKMPHHLHPFHFIGVARHETNHSSATLSFGSARLIAKVLRSGIDLPDIGGDAAGQRGVPRPSRRARRGSCGRAQHRGRRHRVRLGHRGRDQSRPALRRHPRSARSALS